MAARSLRISNRKLRDASDWVPKYPSVRQGWPSVVGDTSPTLRAPVPSKPMT